MLKLIGIRKTYHTKKSSYEALKGIDLTFKDKGLVFIVGKSGSGKSTLLNIIGGLDDFSSGEIIIDGRSTRTYKKNEFDSLRNYYIGFVFQDFNLIEDITVYDNIALALKLQNKDHDLNTIEDALRMVGLDGLGYRKPMELSGGQRQRVSIARALIKNPAIILADEPTGALDSQTGEKLILSLKKLSKSKLVIVVSHDEEMAFKYGDEIIEIKDGLISGHIELNPNEVIKSKEEILDNLVKYSYGSKVEDISEIEKHLDKSKTNYVCINESSRDVVLAYPEAFEKIYEKEDKRSVFVVKEETEDKVDLVTNNTKLPKNKIAFKECLKMAFDNFKRLKRKLIGLIFMSVCTLSLFFNGFFISSIDHISYNVNKIKEDNIPYALISSNKDDVIFDGKTKAKIEEEINEKVYPTYYDNYNQGVFAYQSASIKTYSMRLNKIIVIDDVKELDLKLIYGENAKSDDEFVISDYYAYNIVSSGYIGYLNGEKKVIYPKEVSEIVGTYVNFVSNGVIFPVKISGIVQTDFKEGEYSKNKVEIFYKVAYCHQDFKHFDKLLESLIYFELYGNNNDKSVFVDFFEFSSLGGNVYPLKDAIKEGIVKNVTSLNYNDVILPTYLESVINDQSFDSFSFKVYSNGGLLKKVDNLNIVEYIYNNSIVVNDDLFEDIKEMKANNPNGFTIPIPKTKEGTKKIFKDIDKLGFSLIYNEDFRLFQALIDVTGVAFLSLSAFFFVGALLTILNYTFTIVRKRKKELGILISLGASKKDILKIYLVEMGIINVIVSFICFIFIRSGSNTINNLLPGLGYFNFVNCLIVFVAIGLILFICLIIPLRKVLKAKPVDSMKRIF